MCKNDSFNESFELPQQTVILKQELIIDMNEHARIEGGDIEEENLTGTEN